jgi:hypothetical protein
MLNEVNAEEGFVLIAKKGSDEEYVKGNRFQ